MRIYNFFDKDLRAMSGAVEKLERYEEDIHGLPRMPDGANPDVQRVKNQFRLFLQSQPSEKSINTVIGWVNNVQPSLGAAMMEIAASGNFPQLFAPQEQPSGK